MTTVTLLFVDAIALTQREAALRARGYDLVSTCDPLEADLLLDFVPDLLIVDSAFDRHRGLDLVARLRRTNAQLPVLVLSGGKEVDYRRGYAAGATDCLDRQISDPVFLAKCARLLTRTEPGFGSRDRAALPRTGEALFQRYRLDQELGKGSYGAVYAGHDLLEDRRVAVKVMLQCDQAGEEARERFMREGYTLGAARSRSLPRVYEFGEREGVLFCVMELVEGPTLRQRVRDTGVCDERELRAFLRSMGQGLEALHAKGYVHRDIKPANIVLRNGRFSDPVLVDFGLTKGLFDAGITAPDVIMGTPGYLAPEVLCGPAVPQSDLFSLGMVALLAAFGDDFLPHLNGLALVQAMATEETQIPDWFSEALRETLRQLTRVLPEERMQTAGELLDALNSRPACS